MDDIGLQLTMRMMWKRRFDDKCELRGVAIALDAVGALLRDGVDVSAIQTRQWLKELEGDDPTKTAAEEADQALFDSLARLPHAEIGDSQANDDEDLAGYEGRLIRRPNWSCWDARVQYARAIAAKKGDATTAELARKYRIGYSRARLHMPLGCTLLLDPELGHRLARADVYVKWPEFKKLFTSERYIRIKDRLNAEWKARDAEWNAKRARRE